MKTFSRFALCGVALLASLTAAAQAPAFPGAEGHGRYVKGGRGGKVVHVTNLNDKGTGSFRAAVSGNDAKIVVFDVAGVIPLASDITIGKNTTILGQTAPEPGITLRYYTVRPSENNVIRFIRIRRGAEKDINDGADASWQRQTTGIIIDHCSLSWSIDEVASFYDNNNFTLQWSTIAESLTNPGHSKGAHGYGGIWGGKLASFHHNLLAHLMNRGPRFCGARYAWADYTRNYDFAEYNWANTVQAENVDFRNCLIYDAQGTCYGGPGGGQVNIVGNYFKAGPSHSLSKTTQTVNGSSISVSVSTGKERGNQDRITTVSVATKDNADKNHTELYGLTSRYYISGNTTVTTAAKKTANRDWSGVTYDSGVHELNGERYTEDPHSFYDADHVEIDGVQCVKIKLDSPAPTGSVTTHSAEEAYEKVMQYAGASLYPDQVDARYMEEARTGTCTYKGSITKSPGIIDQASDVNAYTQDDFGPASRPAGFDTDGDGMPDAWETAHGLNPNDASDGAAYTLDTKKWYTNLEVYANSLVESIMKGGNADALSAVDEYYPVLTTTSLPSAPTAGRVVGFEYYSLSGKRLAEPANGISVRRTLYAGGSSSTDLVMKK